MVQPGVAVGGRYRVERLAGSGAAAEVWRARDVRSDRVVALKVLNSRSAQVRRRFFREGQLARRLAHPNVVRVLEVVDDPACLVLEWVDGPTLAERIATGPVPLADAERWFRGIAEAVGHAHAHGVVHRDLKPANILLAGDVPKVTDFGIARDLTEGGMTATGTVLGTPWYMAPEQVRSTRTVDHRADVFALGVILYELVLGVRPFQVEGLVALYQAHQADRWVRPETVRADLPRRFSDAIAGALTIDPGGRTANVPELLLHLGGGAGELSDPDEFTADTTTEIPRAPESAPLGREGDLAALRARLARGDVALVGPPGIGKSRLARAIPGLLVEAAGARDAAALRRAVARAAGVSLAADPAETDARIAARLAEVEVVVLDGADEVAPGGLLDAWRSGDRPRFLWVARAPVEGTPTFTLGPLPNEAARQLLLGRASMLDPDDLDPLLDRLGGNPLAIELASARLGRETPGALAALARPDDPTALIQPDERRILARLSVFAGSFSEADARAVLGPAGALDRLVERGLLRRGGRGLIVPPALRAAPSDRELGAYRARVVEAAGPPWAEWIDDIRAVHTSDPAFAARVAVPVALALDLPTAWELVDGPWVAGVLDPDRRAELAIARARIRRLQGHAPDGELADDFAGAGPATLAALHLARLSAAKPSDDVVRALADPVTAAGLAVRGVAEMRLGRDEAACASLERALAGSLPPDVRVDALIELGAAHGRAEQYAAAQVRFDEALRTCAAEGFRLLEGRIHKVAGATLAAAGRMDEAERHFAAAQRIARALGDQRTVATLLGTRAELALAEGRIDQVNRLMARAMPIAERAGEPGVLAWFELLLCAAEEDAGRPGRAEARARRSLDLATRSGAVHLAAIGSSWLAALLADGDRLGEAEAALASIPREGLGPVAPHRDLAEAHVDLARGRRGDRRAASRARATHAALAARPNVDLRWRLGLLAERLGGRG